MFPFEGKAVLGLGGGAPAEGPRGGRGRSSTARVIVVMSRAGRLTVDNPLRANMLFFTSIGSVWVRGGGRETDPPDVEGREARGGGAAGDSSYCQHLDKGLGRGLPRWGETRLPRRREEQKRLPIWIFKTKEERMGGGIQEGGGEEDSKGRGVFQDETWGLPRRRWGKEGLLRREGGG